MAREVDEDLAGGRLTIDLGALVANWRNIAGRVGNASAAGVVKGDAYGIGIEPAAAALARAGCHTFFVALPGEGRRVRQTVQAATIYVLNGLVPGGAEAYAADDLRPVLGSWPEIEEWAAFRRRGARTGSAIQVDTGMNRLGLTMPEARLLAEQRSLRDVIAPTLVMSHLAAADTPDHPLNRKQLTAFRMIRPLFPGVPASLANSSGIFLGPDYHFDLVRPGIALYGARAASGENALATVVTAEARVLQVREAEAGETVGYGAGESLRRNTRIAIVGAGYADGYHRRAGSSDRRRGARAFLRDRDAPILGRVSMDLMALDVTDNPAVKRGDWAELFGPHVPIDEVAEHADTIGYELLTSLGERYHRRYRSQE